MIIIFTFNRREPLLRTLDELEGKDDIIIFDDGSTYNRKPFEKRVRYIRNAHGGKKGFYRMWHQAFRYCKISDHDRFIFLPDDMCNFQWEEIHRIYNMLDGKFACNVADVGWYKCWTPIHKHLSHYKGLFRVGWVDQGTITNRETLEALEWTVYKIPKKHYVLNNSSGVGKQISTRLHNLGIPMYMPCESIANFQDVESQMYPGSKTKFSNEAS